MKAMCQVPLLQNTLAGCLQRITQPVFRVTGLMFSKEMEAMTKPAGSLYTMMKPHDSKGTSRAASAQHVSRVPYLRTAANRMLKLVLMCLSQKAETMSLIVFADSLGRKVFDANDKIRAVKRACEVFSVCETLKLHSTNTAMLRGHYRVS